MFCYKKWKIFLANICKKVYSHEIRKDFYEIAKKNIEKLNLKNIILKNQDIFKGIIEKNLDLITLDLSEPWKAVKNAIKALKIGAFLINYSPSTPQITDLISEIKKHKNLQILSITELIKREWHFEGRKIHPHYKMLGHSGFILIARKIGKWKNML